MSNKCNLKNFFIALIMLSFSNNSINSSTLIRKLNDSPKKNLLIGSFINYSWPTIRNYFISLIKAQFENCDIVIFVGRTTQNTKDKLKSYGIIVNDMPQELMRYNVQNYRWKVYEDFLIANKEKYNLVFTADIKDAIFQKDIFKYYDSNKPFLGVFYEDLIFKNAKMNRDWLSFYAGREKVNEFNSSSIICSGTLIGTIDKFIEFSHKIWELMLERNDVINIRDQGAANYMIYYYKYFNDCLIAKDNHGPIMTLSNTKRENITLDENNNLINFNGEIAAVVHQYNRHDDIVDKMNKKYDDTDFNFSYYNTSNNNKTYFNNKTKELNKNNPTFIKIIAYVILIISIIIFLIYLFILFKRSKKFSKKKKKKFRKVKVKIYDEKD